MGNPWLKCLLISIWKVLNQAIGQPYRSRPTGSYMGMGDPITAAARILSRSIRLMCRIRIRLAAIEPSFTSMKQRSSSGCILFLKVWIGQFHVWINGHSVGYSQGSHFHSEFYVSPYLREGQNVIAVRVYQWCDGSYLESQDKWRMSGIFRDVYLLSSPQVSVRDARVRTHLHEGYAKASLEVRAQLAGVTDAPFLKSDFFQLRMTLLDRSVILSVIATFMCGRMNP